MKGQRIAGRGNRLVASLLCGCALGAATGVAAAGEIKVLLCTGDYGMWSQDRAALIRELVVEAAPGPVHFETEQAFNFVKKLEAPGYAPRFDVIVFGDIALGQITTRAQEAMVRFAEAGGSLVYIVFRKSTVPFKGSTEAEPMPLADALPYAFPDVDPVRHARESATPWRHTDALFEGLDFSGTPLLTGLEADAEPPPIALERELGQGRVIALYGAYGANYRSVGYAQHKRVEGGWDEWDGLGGFWARLLGHAAAGSPIRELSRADVEARIEPVPVTATLAVDANEPIDEVRAAMFSMVGFYQLYNEDRAAGEDAFLELNPQDWFDRRTHEVLDNSHGRYPDKRAMLRKYNMRGMIMARNSYGSYDRWSEEKFESEVNEAITLANEHPDILTFLQSGNEPPCNAGYFEFHNRYTDAVLAGAPDLQVVGPGIAWGPRGADERELEAYVENSGDRTDILNWHIYARPPSSVRAQVLHWTERAAGRLRSDGPVRVMFTEADAWNTRESQFNYLLDRAFTFLPMPEILACFQYCIRPRYEGGTYWFGVLMAPQPAHVQPPGEFTANYNGYWIFRNLRGKRLASTAQVSPAAAAEHCRSEASVAPDGSSVTLVAYYDTGYLTATQRGEAATFRASVTLPPGQFRLERSFADWSERETASEDGPFSGTVEVETTLAPCEATAWTWERL